MSYTSDALTLIQDGRKFTKADLAAGIQCSHDQVRTLIQNLLATGRIRIVARDVGLTKKTIFTVTPFGREFLESGQCRRRPRTKPLVHARPPRSLGVVESGRMQPNSVWALGAM